MPHVQRKIVIVSGAPGAGKTTLAVPLAQRLGFPLFSKDFIKETLTDVFGDGGGDLAPLAGLVVRRWNSSGR